jgi:hypothetical protein
VHVTRVHSPPFELASDGHLRQYTNR